MGIVRLYRILRLHEKFILWQSFLEKWDRVWDCGDWKNIKLVVELGKNG